MYTYKKHPRTCPNNMIDSEEFFLFTVVFLQPFALFSFLCFFFLHPLFLESLFVLYTMIFVPFSPSTCESDVGSFFCSRSPFLEPSTLSCKAACLLFRHHLHMNAARELAGQHLMRGSSTSRYLFSLILILYLIFSHPLCCKVLLICYIKGLRRLLATSDRGSEVVIILRHG